MLINTCKFSFQSLGAQTLEELKLQDVPIVQGYTIYMDEKSWAENPQGVTPLDVNLSISQPELDGVIQGGVVACQPMMSVDTSVLACERTHRCYCTTSY